MHVNILLCKITLYLILRLFGIIFTWLLESTSENKVCKLNKVDVSEL